MAYENFIPTIETKKMLKERDKYLVFAEHCTREWEGEIKSRGDSIKINGVGSPTVWMLQKNGTYTSTSVIDGDNGKTTTAKATGNGKDVIHRGIPTWEEVETYSINLPVNQQAVWNYGVGDLDQQMMTEKGMVNKLRDRQAKRLADVQDKYVAKVMANFKPCQYSDSATEVNKDSVLDLIDSIVLRLNEQNVTDSEQLYCECSPRFWSVLKKAYVGLDTDNSGLLAHRKLGRYNDVIIAKTNNSIVDNQDYIYIHTKDAVAFFDPKTTNEAYRPEGGFADCVKGFSWFDCGIVDKNALVVAKVTY